MRAAFALALLALAGPAIAQERNGSLDIQTINGVRVWRPKPAPAPAVVPAAPPSTTVVVVNAPPAAPETGEVIGLPVGSGPTKYPPGIRTRRSAMACQNMGAALPEAGAGATRARCGRVGRSARV